MRCAIMQPTYLPWSGYFNLIQSVDVFVFLDDVQFEASSWQVRNAIALGGARHVLSIPVQSAPLRTRINEIRISDRVDWRRRHLATLKSAYQKSAHGPEVLGLLAPLIADDSIQLLSNLTCEFVIRACTAGGLQPRLLRASELGCGGTRSEHVLEICRALGCDEYLSPVGAADYLARDAFAENGSVRLIFQEFEPKPYRQRGVTDFLSHLSIVDVAANLGWEGAMRYAFGHDART
jgi:hypothetical protein